MSGVYDVNVSENQISYYSFEVYFLSTIISCISDPGSEVKGRTGRL